MPVPQRRSASTERSPEASLARKIEALAAENLELRARLEEAEDALRAIREGEVDAVIVSGSKGDRVFSLSETENLHRLMVETMNEAGLAISADGLLLYVNDRAAELLGSGRSGLLGRPIEALVAPSEVPRLRRLLAASQEGTADDRIVFRSAGGAEVPMHLWTSRLPRPGEAITCLVGTDLTRIEADQALLAELREHQRALKASRADALRLMSQALEAREQAARLAQELREGDRRKDAFLATLAHELRNPLAPIRNALEILGLQETEAADAIEAREMMGRQLDHLVRLVDDLMEVSRITQGRVDLRKERVTLASVIESAVETVRPLLQANGERLSVDLPPDGVWLDGDPLRLSQIFSNLLNNAIKYSEAGQTIRVIARPRAEGVIEVSVQDTGAGIPADILPRVFDLFTRGHASPTLRQGGLGIGLTLVRELVGLHGGRVEALSAGPGQGSEFRVHLPLAEGEAKASARPAQVSDGSGATVLGRRILVVDDNHDAAASLTKLLVLQGAAVRVVHDGRSALSVLEDYPAEVVILDIDMPDLDGHEVARRIRAHPDWQGVRLIALTGLGEAAVRQRSLEAGFDRHLIKPVPFNVLAEAIASPDGDRDRAHAVLGNPVAPSSQPPVAAPVPTEKAEHGAPGAIASTLLHDLAQPLSSAGCFAVAARTLATRSGTGSAPLCDALNGIEQQIQVAHSILELLRGVLLQSVPGPSEASSQAAHGAQDRRST